jgi:carboxyl-terminal processing protease
LKVTVSKFYRPSGSSTQLRGVRPDITLPSFTDSPEISESGMKNPMEWDTVPSAHYSHFDLVAPFAAKLRDQSRARISAERDFAWWNENLALVEKNRASKSISLNEAERRAERDGAKARNKAHQAERLARKEAAPLVYEITVKNAAAPGLPPPIDPAKPKAAAAAAKDADADDADSALPAEDLLLHETQHILADYVDLLTPAGSPTLTRR